MHSVLRGAGLLAWACGAMIAQTLEFEVASVKAASPQEGGRIFVGRQGGPGSPDPGRVTFTNYTLKSLLGAAYNVKPYQITGPAWLDTERYDVVAKVPVGASKEQVAQMLQTLLTERFKIQLHHTSKEFPLYELVVGKNGPKLKASAEDPNAANAPLPGPPSGPFVPPPLGKDGFPVMPPGRKGMMMMASGGPLHIAANVQSMKDLADLLGNQLGSPVVDKTGLAGTYDFTLDFIPEQGKGGLAGLGPGPGGPGGLGLGAGPGPGAAPGTSAIPGPGFGGAPPAANAGDAPNLMGALQEQLGLKLEQRKGPLDVLVIDQAEKVPIEN